MSVMAWLMVGLIVVPISAMVWAFISVDRGGLAAVRSNLGRGTLGGGKRPGCRSRGHRRASASG